MISKYENTKKPATSNYIPDKKSKLKNDFKKILIENEGVGVGLDRKKVLEEAPF